MRYKSCFIFYILISFISFPVMAQKMFYSGYVVTNNNDTLYGKIPYDIGTNNNYHIVDLKDPHGYVKKFNVWQIKMYCMNNEFYFTKKCERGEMQHRKDLVFMHLIQQGEVKLYEYEFARKIGASRSYEEGGLTPEGERDYYAEKAGGELIYFPRLTYKKVLREFIREKPECVALIDAKDFEYKSIPELIKCYNSK